MFESLFGAMFGNRLTASPVIRTPIKKLFATPQQR